VLCIAFFSRVYKGWQAFQDAFYGNTPMNTDEKHVLVDDKTGEATVVKFDKKTEWEGLPGIIVDGALRTSSVLIEWLEKPSSPLDPDLRGRLMSLEDTIAGLEMQPDKRSLEEETDPNMLYAFFKHTWLGTCYGKGFSESPNANSCSEHSAITSIIHDAYKPSQKLAGAGVYRTAPEDDKN